MRMNVHIGKICSKAFRGPYNIRHIRKFLTVQSTKTLIHAFVSLHLDYCNTLLFGLPKYQLGCLQEVQNAVARVFFFRLQNLIISHPKQNMVMAVRLVSS